MTHNTPAEQQCSTRNVKGELIFADFCTSFGLGEIFLDSYCPQLLDIN